MRFHRIAVVVIWTTFKITATDVPLCMIAVKLARQVHRHKRDNLVDIAGYARTAGILSGEVTETEYPVEVTFYCAHVKRGAPEGHPRTLRVDYRVGFNDDRSEWICVEHPPGSYARRKAEAWWAARSNEPCPTDADEAVDLAEAGALAPTHAITVRSVTGEKYDRIVGYQLGDKPQSIAVAETPSREPEYTIPDDEIPF